MNLMNPRDDLIQLQNKLINEGVRRQGLGGYSTDAEAILMLIGITSKIIDYVTIQPPKPRRKKKKK